MPLKNVFWNFPFKLPKPLRRPLVRYAAVLQVVAILLLQWYVVVPHLGQNQPQVVCRGDHAECGCPPENIASGTCCCYNAAPRCHQVQHDEEDLCHTDKDSDVCFFKAVPCGGSAKFLASLYDAGEFLPAELLSIYADAGYDRYPSAPPHPLTTRYMEPPEPPPKTALLS